MSVFKGSIAHGSVRMGNVNRGGVRKDTPQFISEWDTTLISAGSSAANQIKLPTFSGGVYDCIVDYGDGVIEPITAWDQLEVTHTYAVAGIYTIKITGTFTGLDFDDNVKILNVFEFGPLRLLNADNGFADCFNVEFANAIDVLNVEGLTVLNNKFGRCRAVTGGYANINPAQTIAMSRTFIENNLLTESPNFSTPNLENLSETYRNCLLFDGDVSSLTTSKVSTFQQTFSGCPEFTGRGLSTLDMSSATTLRSMLQGTKANFNFGAWNLKNVIDATNFLFDTTSQTTENWSDSLIGQATPKYAPASSNITTFLDGGVGVTTVETSFVLPPQIVDGVRIVISDNVDYNGIYFNIFNVNNAAGTFQIAKTNIPSAGGTWTFDGVKLQPDVPMHGGSAKYNLAGQVARDYLISQWNWVIIDGGLQV